MASYVKSNHYHCETPRIPICCLHHSYTACSSSDMHHQSILCQRPLTFCCKTCSTSSYCCCRKRSMFMPKMLIYIIMYVYVSVYTCTYLIIELCKDNPIIKTQTSNILDLYQLLKLRYAAVVYPKILPQTSKRRFSSDFKFGCWLTAHCSKYFCGNTWV